VLQQQTIEFRSSFTRTRTDANLTVGQEYVAGSGADNEIILQGQDVLTQHAKLTLLAEGLRVEPVKQAPISVNGHPISESTLLDDGDWLSLGSCLFQINFPRSSPRTCPKRFATIQAPDPNRDFNHRTTARVRF
jgi:Inner membrane component of T3SS, cytoplasmic domain